MIGRRDIFFFSGLLCFFPYSRLSSYLLRLFLSLISFLLFPCASVWENTCAFAQFPKHLRSSPFPIAILNGTFFFCSVKAMNNWKWSAIKQILLLLLSIPVCEMCILPAGTIYIPAGMISIPVEMFYIPTAHRCTVYACWHDVYTHGNDHTSAETFFISGIFFYCSHWYFILISSLHCSNWRMVTNNLTVVKLFL